MAADPADYFQKVTPTFSTTIGAAGVADGTTTTFPLVSVSGIPTDTGIDLVINRIDGTGEVTNNYETITGIVSGSNIVSCVRGVEGTAQGWNAGVVVEMLSTANTRNLAATGILVDHAQTGKHNQITFVGSAGPNPTTAGLVKFDTTNKEIQYGDGSTTRVVVSKAQTQTLTNKRITKRTDSQASTDTITPEISTYDIFVRSAQSHALVINNHSTSTPADGDMMLFEILDNGTARAITYGDKYVAKAGVALPTTTTLSKNLTMLFIWRADLSKWNLLFAGNEA